jgi:hypothetical protein
VRFLIDYDVYRITVPFLRSLGHDVLTAYGGLPDPPCPGDLMKAHPVPPMDVNTGLGERELVRGENP